MVFIIIVYISNSRCSMRERAAYHKSDSNNIDKSSQCNETDKNKKHLRLECLDGAAVDMNLKVIKMSPKRMNIVVLRNIQNTHCNFEILL